MARHREQGVSQCDAVLQRQMLQRMIEGDAPRRYPVPDVSFGDARAGVEPSMRFCCCYLGGRWSGWHPELWRCSVWPPDCFWCYEFQPVGATQHGTSRDCSYEVVWCVLSGDPTLANSAQVSGFDEYGDVPSSEANVEEVRHSPDAMSFAVQLPEQVLNSLPAGLACAHRLPFPVPSRLPYLSAGATWVHGRCGKR
jgi:hypothetical protein